MTLEDIVNELPAQFDKNQAAEVLQALGRSFGLQPELLRLDDSITTLNELDSWMLGSGQEKFSRWLATRGITTLESKPQTIRDLVLYVLASHAFD